MRALKITAIGNSFGVILPKEELSRLHVGKGDSLYVAETPNGIELTPYSKEFEVQAALAENIMSKKRDVLKKLAE